MIAVPPPPRRPGPPGAPQDPPRTVVNPRVLLAALEGQAKEAVKLALRAQTTASYTSLVPHLRFRRQIDEFRSLASLLADRLDNMEPQRAIALRRDFERLDRVVLLLILRTMRAVFEAVLKSGALPLGARDVLRPDVKLLQEAQEKLKIPSYAERLGPRVLADLVGAGAALKNIFEHVPDLPDFSGLPGLPPPVEVRVAKPSPVVRQ